MDLILGNLDSLKQFILPEATRAQDDHDVVLAALGKSVAGMFEKICNRRFARAVNAEETFTADRTMWFLARTPVEAVVSVAVKTSDSDGWAVQAGAVQVSALDRGLIDFGGELGDWRSRVRVIYTGGFFVDTLEPADVGYPSAVPVGSTALPSDLRAAWLMQTQAIFEGKDHLLPKGFSPDGGNAIPLLLKDVPVLPVVTEILRGFTRYQLT